MTTPPRPDEPVGVYWGVASLMVVLGIFLMLSPNDWFGPSWHFFHALPANGFWMGLCCTMLGTWQLLVLWRNHQRNLLSRKLLAVLFFLGSFVLWTAGTIIIIAGLQGHQGLQEGPPYLILAGHKVLLSSQLYLRALREKRVTDEWR